MNRYSGTPAITPEECEQLGTLFGRYSTDMQFGEVAVVCKIHNGKLVKTMTSRTDQAQTTFPG